MRKRTLIPLLIAILLLCALGAMLYLRAIAPPEAARLLPESDAIVFINLKSVRSVTHFDQTPIERTPDFQHFIDATGIVPERDLDSVALALHRMADPTGPNGPVAYSEVFTGRFDGVRLAAYLHSIASSEESYTGRTIYTIPVGDAGRHLRIAQIGYDILAARYHDVPLLSEAWGIGHIGLPFSSDDDPNFISVLGLQLPLRTNTDFVASLRYTAAAHVLSGGAVHLRIEEISPDSTAATATVDTLSNLLNVLRGIAAEQLTAQPSNASTDASLAILNSITLTHRDARVFLNANASLDQLKALTTAHNPAASPLSPSSDTSQSPHATQTAPAASN
jgi:hypothetical protein